MGARAPPLAREQLRDPPVAREVRVLHPLYEIEHGPTDRARSRRIEERRPPFLADLPLLHVADPRISTDRGDSIRRRWLAHPSFLT
jgi:hypothetical protein